jgi:malate/lactate dehydrogenase
MNGFIGIIKYYVVDCGSYCLAGDCVFITGTPGVTADVGHIYSRAKVAGYMGEEQLGTAFENVDVVIIPAGVPRKPGMTRDGLFNIHQTYTKGEGESVCSLATLPMFIVFLVPLQCSTVGFSAILFFFLII